MIPLLIAAFVGHLPSWVQFGGEYRMRVESFQGMAFREANGDTHALNRVRLNLGIRPTDWLKFFVQGQDARIWGNQRVPSGPPYKDSMDLRQGYLELGDSDKKSFGLRAGRQELVFGEQRLIGHTSWSNTARTFDAVRATVRFAGVRLDAWASSVVVIRDDRFNRPDTGNNFHGLYASAAPGEAYALWRVAPGLDFRTYGARRAGKLPGGFDYSVEMAFQAGTAARQDLRAWAGHWLAGYTVRAPWSPRLIAEYNYASGDRDPGDNRRGTFDSLYPTPHSKYGYTDQVGWRNIHDVHFGLELKPRPRWLAGGHFHNWWLASTRDFLYNAPGTPLFRVPDGSAGRHVGEEFAVEAAYSLSKQLQIGAAVGRAIPGEFLKRVTPGHSYTCPYILLNYTF
ncbi:MAG: alginate export family protein [Bryobacteraceae bacterium]